MTKDQRRFLNLIRKVQDKYRGQVYKAIRDQINYFIGIYEENPNALPERLPTLPLIRALRGIYEDAGVNNALAVRRQIKRSLKQAPTDPIQKMRWMTNEYYRQNLLNQAVKPITNTTKKQILQVLEQANEEGWGVKKTVAALRKTDLTKARAELIVRTESMKAANAGAMLGAAEMGIAVQKEWISAQQDRTRRIPRDQYDHLHMNGIRVNYNDAFVIPSTKSIDMMQYPGDPSGSAGNVCNCRCTVAFVPIRDELGSPVGINRMSPVNNIFMQIANQAVGLFITGSLIDDLISQIESFFVE